MDDANDTSSSEARAELTASRRILLRSGLTGALGVGGAVVLAAIAAPDAASAATAPRPRASTATPLKPKPRAIATKPYAHGGPASRDQSAAASIPTGAASVTTGAQYKTYSAAAKASIPLDSALFSKTDHQAHLLRRATFGARPADVAELRKLGVDKWLAQQFEPSKIHDPDGDAAWKAFPLAGATPTTINKKTVQYSWDAQFATAQATLGKQIFSKRQLFEITADIFASHLHVALPAEQWNTAPGYVKNVIRANSFGKFSTMLLAGMRHPAMLQFLSNDQSRKEHVNENLGRELLELHTVGVASGYTEDDVKASAAILSGRMIDYDKGTYVYDPDEHATGAVTVLGFTSTNATGKGGQAVGDAYLTYLAHHPSTAKNIARKIATRFVSDQPSDDLIQRLANAYLASGTSILATVKAVFLSSDFWSAVGIRMRRPLEDTVGAARVLNVGRGTTTAKTATGITNLYWSLWNQGNAPLGWNPPNGYPDVAAAWLGAGSMIDRWNGHRSLVYGWSGDLAYTLPSKQVAVAKGDTIDSWINKAAIKLIGGKTTPEHLAAIVAGCGLKPGTPAPTNDWQLGMALTLLLDSAYFQLR
jgi:uncharacterized protein (DUF1800 family)